MEGLCPCGHEPTGSIVPVSELVRQCCRIIYYKKTKSNFLTIIAILPSLLMSLEIKNLTL